MKLLSSGRIGGARYYAEAFTYACPQHGVVFHTREGIKGKGPDDAGPISAPVTAPLKPAPFTRRAAAALREECT